MRIFKNLLNNGPNYVWEINTSKLGVDVMEEAITDTTTNQPYDMIILITPNWFLSFGLWLKIDSLNMR